MFDVKYHNKDNPLNEWKSMPEFKPEGTNEFFKVTIEFSNNNDFNDFLKLIDAKTSGENRIAKSIWYPKLIHYDYDTVRYSTKKEYLKEMRYPIYIPSKGRWDNRKTSDTLIELGIKHYIVVEKEQYELYKSHTNPEWVTLLILPQEYLDNYNTCDDLGNTRSKGPGAARNFAWDHSISLGFKRHWVMDDNQRNFYRLNGNRRLKVSDCSIFVAMEDHADQYTNVYMSGPHYRFFAVPDKGLKPFALNTRIYSCNLILNDIPYRWRGRYNEDTDLSLQILKDGYCTIQYYAFLTGKAPTQSMKGGNTEEFYSKEGTLAKSKMLEDMHPDVAKVVWRFNRWHHYVNYLPFRNNRLIRDKYVPDEMNNYGMELIYDEKDE